MLDRIDEAKLMIFFIAVSCGIIELGNKEHKMKTKFEKLCIFLTQFCFAMFVSPLVAWVFERYTGENVTQKMYGALALICGLFGKQSLIFIMGICKKLDWKSILMVMINGDKKK